MHSLPSTCELYSLLKDRTFRETARTLTHRINPQPQRHVNKLPHGKKLLHGKKPLHSKEPLNDKELSHGAKRLYDNELLHDSKPLYDNELLVDAVILSGLYNDISLSTVARLVGSFRNVNEKTVRRRIDYTINNTPPITLSTLTTNRTQREKAVRIKLHTVYAIKMLAKMFVNPTLYIK